MATFHNAQHNVLCVCVCIEWVYECVFVCVQCALDIFNLPAIKRQLKIATLMRPKVYNGLTAQTEVRVFHTYIHIFSAGYPLEINSQ